MKSAVHMETEASAASVLPIEVDVGGGSPSAGGAELRQHPLSAAFPAMSDEDYIALKDSIESIGVQNAITLFDGMVIDGWHRWRAATELCMNCPTQTLGDVDPRDFVLAQNKARRHVTAAQMAMAIAAVYSWRPVGANQHGGSALSADPSKSTSELAAIAGVGTRTIEQAKAVISATREVQAAVKAGEIGLPKAAAIAKLPQDEQATAIKQPLARKPRSPATAKRGRKPGARPTSPEADQNAHDAHGDTNMADLLTETQSELEAAQRTIAAMKADDKAAEIAKWQRIADVATREKDMTQAKLVEREAEIKRHVNALRLIGRAVGEDDPARVATTAVAFLHRIGAAA
jgi:hypothetical protein